ncbi:MAG TPA: hypothetical protein DIT43_01870 [Dehalococcoidia bacterium]|nr:hypothetical protein [Dehalococcoidia bacterium]
MAEFDENTNFTDFLTRLERIQGCEQAVDHYQAFRDRPCREAFDDLRDNPLAERSWAAWLMLVFKDKMSQSIRRRAIDKIIDPMTAYHIYVQCDYLTDEEDILLEAKFRGKLPNCEAALDSGAIQRVKDGGRGFIGGTEDELWLAQD